MTRGRAWLVVLPLLVVGGQVGHALLGLLAPTGYQGAEVFERSGLGGGPVPPLLALAAALVVRGLALHAVSGRAVRISRRTVTLLPLLVFAVQEHVEYALGHGRVPWTLALQPAFVLGLGLQLPFALVAYSAARLLFVATELVAQRRARAFLAPTSRPAALPRPAVRVACRRARPSGEDRFTRGPPLPIAA